MDGPATSTEPTNERPEQSTEVAGPAVPASTRHRWTWPKMHHLLFLAFTFVAGVPIAVLAIWEGQTAYQNELDSVRERHLLVARNLTSTMSRYVNDLKATFSLAFASGSLTRPTVGLNSLLTSLNVIDLCIFNPDGS